jgi:transcription factor IIIB subunit 2
VAFGEASNGAANVQLVQGSFVGQGAHFYFLFYIIKSYSSESIDPSSPVHARMSGPYANRGNNESRNQMIGNGALRFSNAIMLPI